MVLVRSDKSTQSGATMYQHVSYWQCDDDTYRFLEGDETAWVSSGQAGHGTSTRPSSSPKTIKGDGHTSAMQANTHKERPYHKTISFVFSASFFEVRHNQGPHPNKVRHHVD